MIFNFQGVSYVIGPSLVFHTFVSYNVLYHLHLLALPTVLYFLILIPGPDLKLHPWDWASYLSFLRLSLVLYSKQILT